MIRPLKYKKIYIDSKYRTYDSNSTSDFKIQLRENFEIPDNTVMYIHEIAIPNVMHTIEEDVNNFVYFVLTDDSNVKINQYIIKFNGSYILTPQGLLDLVVGEMNRLTALTDTDIFVGTYYPTRNIFGITSLNATSGTNYKFKILTDEELNTGFNGYWDDSLNTNDKVFRKNMSPILGNFNGSLSAEYASRLLYLQPYPNVYINCPELSNYNFHSPSGWSNAIIKKVPVNVPFGSIIFEGSSVAEKDTIDVSKRSIQRLSFRITDETGNVINFHNTNISFSLLFYNSTSEL